MRWFLVTGITLMLLTWQYLQQSSTTPEAALKMQPSVSASHINTLDSNEASATSFYPDLTGNDNWLSSELKILFDHYLLEFEQDSAAMWLAFTKHCKQLTGCEQITALFQRYVTYKKALVSLDDYMPQSISEISNRLTALANLRQEFFTNEEIAALFGNERQWQQSALERLAIRANSSISQKEKDALLQQHYESLDDDAYRAISPSLRLEKVSQWSNSNDINLRNYNQLASEFGPEAADRLIVMENKRNDWQQRVLDFERKAATMKSNLSGSELIEAVNSLKSKMFSTNEIKRLEVVSPL